jgi:copper oxidase (laccase) domain-containing protein
MITGALQYDHKVKIGNFQVWSGPPSLTPLPLRVKQVHDITVIPTGSSQDYSKLEADGLIHSYYQQDPLHQKPSLAIVTADCLPILFWGAVGYGMVHAGWRGLSKGILLDSQITKLAPTNFFIGPHICQKCYEVDFSFIDHFPESSSFNTIDDHCHFSLEDEARAQITTHFQGAVVESMGKCTMHDSRLHSYRRNQTEERNWNVIIIK